MHGVELVLQDDSTSSILIQESERDLSSLCVGSSHSRETHRSTGSNIGQADDRMPMKSQPSMQQAAAITKAPLKVAANKAKNELSKTLSKISHGTSTPGRSATKTFSGANRDGLQVETSSPNSLAQDDEQEGTGAAPNEYSRRLVEYFVVVSSVPKLNTDRERVNSIDVAQKKGYENEIGADTNRGYERETPKVTNHKSLAIDVDRANQPIVPPPSSNPTSNISPRIAARVDKRRGHLRESFRPGESVIPAVNTSTPNVMVVDDDEEQTVPLLEFSRSTSAIQTSKSDSPCQQSSSTSKTKGNRFPSMAEQKKKFSEQTKKLGRQASELRGQLDTKMKSIHIGRSFSGDLEKHPQNGDDVEDSSFSSFSIDEDSPSNVPLSALQPSASPIASNRCLNPPPEAPNQQREGGATENIRIDDSFFTSASSEFINDIDDCILEPVITAQYPPVDRPDQPLNPMITHFCYPQGVENIRPEHEYKMAKIHHFVLTDSKGGKMYGTCLTVYEELHIEYEGNQGGVDGDDISVASAREDDQERNYVECSISGPPTVRLHRRRSKNHTYYSPRVLCLLSTWPYLSAFRTYLTQLYRMATTTSLMKAPLERYILNICEEVPAPPPGSFEVQLSILENSIRIWAPPADQPIPYVSVNYGVLFECLDISNVLYVWNTLACERKILLVSSQLSLLTVCAEILCSMIFPMRWSHLYIPVLPRFLTPMLDAPMPYLCGISRENFPHAISDISDETVVVDLDRNLITTGTQAPELPILPQRRKLKLEAALEKHAGHVFWKARGLTKSRVESVRLSGDENAIEEMLGRANAVWDEQLCSMDEAFYLAHSPDSMSILYDKDDISLKQSRWDAVQEAFLRFYVAMLKDYRKFLPSTTVEQKSWRASMMNGDSSDPRFLADEFVESQRFDFQPFLTELVSTQMFDTFITRRIYNAGKAPDVTFFDQSIDAKKNRSKMRLKKTETPFLNAANARRNLKRVQAIEPNNIDVPTSDDTAGEYLYPTWPESFDESLFGTPRPIPKIITAEFDRRAALTAMLKGNSGVAEERLSGCFNPSAEATAFVLFFVMFTQIIGSDWTQFKKQHGCLLDDGFDFDAGDSTNEAQLTAPATPWKPAINPPWMAGENFHSLHSNLRPQEKNETIVDEKTEESPYNTCCIPDCDNFCNEKTLDPTTYIGMPWAQSNTSEPNRNNDYIPHNDEFENELVKARSVAKAQVDLGVNTLKMMRRRKLPGESITYKSLIEACGRCGIAHRATQLLEMMTQDGLQLDSEVYYCFMRAFALNGDTEATMSSHYDTMSEISAFAPSAVSGTSSSAIPFNRRASHDSSTTLGSRITKHSSRFLGEINHVMTSSLEENKRAFKSARSIRMNNLFKRNLTKEKDIVVTNAIKTHLDLSNCILDDLYPGLIIDTGSDTCPKCSCVLSQDNIILGWKPCEVRDFSTTCPSCKHRFVPKFSVACSLESFEGSQGAGTTLFVDYLSPWVLLHQIKNIIAPSGVMEVKSANEDSGNLLGVGAIIDPEFREGNGINATLWWNIVVTFKRFKIPYTFLLQGSFPDQQLIMPTPDDL